MYLGVDCAHVNGKVLNGAAAQQQRMSFAIAKASQGTHYEDAFLDNNVAQARAHGMLPGAYHFLERGNGAAQADHFLAALAKVGGPQGLVCCVDVELQNSTTGPRLADVTAFRNRWESKVGKGRLMLYTGAWYWNGHLGNPTAHGDLPLWVSAYVTGHGDPWSIVKAVTPGYFRPFGGWKGYAVRQFSSSASIGGISPADADVCFDMAVLRKIAGLTTTPTPPAKPVTPVRPTPSASHAAQIKAMQAAVHVPATGRWDRDTDYRLRILRGRTPIDKLQKVVGSHVDGVWGPGTQYAYALALHKVQDALRVPRSGSWDPVTDKAFLALRAACYRP